MTLAATMALIRIRRSWKPASMDGARAVDRKLIDDLLEAACWAPTHGLTEPWRFVVFTGDARRRLSAALPAVYDSVTAPSEVRPEKRQKLGIIFELAPVVIAIAVARRPGETIPEIEEVMAVACAVQNMHLAATAAGLAAMWSTPPLVYADAVKPILGLGEGERSLGFFFVGWPKAGAPIPEGRRTEVAAKVQWVAPMPEGD